MARVSEATKREFRNILRDSRLRKDRRPLRNQFPWQTRIAVRELIELAAAEQLPIHILTGTATEDFYDNVADVLRNALSAGCEVNVLIWNDRERSHECIINLLAAEFPTLMKVTVSGTRRAGEKLPHFLVVGDFAYRLERGHPYFDHERFEDDLNPRIPATVYFNDPEGAKALLEAFGELSAAVTDRLIA